LGVLAWKREPAREQSAYRWSQTYGRFQRWIIQSQTDKPAYSENGALVRRFSLRLSIFDWISYRVSLLVSGSPQFETQDDFGEGNGICAIQQWQRPFSSECNDPNLLDFDALGLDPALCNIVNRLRCILHDLAILSVTDLHDLACFTLHRLMSLPPHTGVESQSPNISECLQYSISAYMLILQGATYYSHAHILNALVIQFQPHLGPLSSIGECQDSLLLWLLSVGAVASTGTNENYWFRGEAAAVSAALDIQCWGDVEAHLKRILWHETRSRDVFQQTWKEILAADLPLHSLAVAEDHEKPRNFSNRVT
jgi:hypothetical protein